MIDVYVSCTAEKQYCNAFGTCSTTCSYHFIKTRQWFHRLSCFNLIFPPEFDVIIWFFTCLLFWSQLLFALYSCKMDTLTVTLNKYLWRFLVFRKFVNFLFNERYVLKINSNIINCIDFGYILPNSCFTAWTLSACFWLHWQVGHKILFSLPNEIPVIKSELANIKIIKKWRKKRELL